MACVSAFFFISDKQTMQILAAYAKLCYVEQTTLNNIKIKFCQNGVAYVHEPTRYVFI